MDFLWNFIWEQDETVKKKHEIVLYDPLDLNDLILHHFCILFHKKFPTSNHDLNFDKS